MSRGPRLSPAVLGSRARALWGNRLARNSALLALNTLVIAGFGFLFWTVAARAYPTAAVGAVAAVTSLLPLLTTLSALGMSENVVRHYEHHPDQLGLCARSAARVSVVATALALLWWAGFHGNAPLASVSGGLWVLPLLLLLLVTNTIGVISTATVIAARRSGLLLAETFAGGVTRLVLGVLLSGMGASGLLIAFVFGAAVSSVTSWLVLLVAIRPRRGHGRDAHRFDHAQRRFAVTNWLAAAVSLAPRSLVVSIIVWRAGAEAAAWVAVPLMMLPFLQMPPSVLGRSLFAESSAHPERLDGLLRRSLLAAFALCSAGALFVALISPWLLSMFGERYSAESTTLLRLLCLAAVCACPNYMLDVALNVRGYRAGFLLTNVLGVLWQLAVILIGSGAGATGVGVAWIISQLGYGAVGFVMYRRSLRPGAPSPRPDLETAPL